LPAGTPAPDFTLHATPNQTLTLKGLRGRPVIVAFYPADWSPVCGDQMALYNEVLPEFQRFNAELLGISVDGVWCHAAFSRDRKLHFPLPDSCSALLITRRIGEGDATTRAC
jgi:peroxiredoxin